MILPKRNSDHGTRQGEGPIRDPGTLDRGRGVQGLIVILQGWQEWPQ